MGGGGDVGGDGRWRWMGGGCKVWELEVRVAGCW